MGPAIEVSEVSKSYWSDTHGEVRALSTTTLSADAGETVAITGPSGSGKSTVLAIAGLLLTPDTGEVLVQGRSVATDAHGRAQARSDLFGYVFQGFNLFEHLNAFDNVKSGLCRSGMSKDATRNAVLDSLARVGLETRVRHMPNEMSGGEQQRVAIARALVKAPPILLADEPTGNLDADNSRTICDLLVGMVDGPTVLLVTHDPAVASRCSRSVSPGAGAAG